MCKTLLGFAHFHRHRRHEPKQQNRTLHLLQKPDIFICYRHDTDTTVVTQFQNEPLPTRREAWRCLCGRKAKTFLLTKVSAYRECARTLLTNQL